MKKALLALLFATTVFLPFNAEARARKPVYLMTEDEKEEHRETKRKQSEEWNKHEIEEATDKYNELPSFDGLKKIMVYQHTAIGGELILTYEDNTEIRFCHYRIYDDETLKCVRAFKLKEEYGNNNFYYVTRQGLFKVNIDKNEEVETIYLIDEVNVDFTEQHFVEEDDYLGLTEIKPIFNKYNVDFGTDWYGYYYDIREKVLEGIK